VTNTLSNSKFYLPTPPEPETSRRSSLSLMDPIKMGYQPLGPFSSQDLTRPRSWDIDSGTGTMLVHPKPVHKDDDVRDGLMESKVAPISSAKHKRSECLPVSSQTSGPSIIHQPLPPVPPRQNLPYVGVGGAKNGILQIGKFYINVASSMIFII